MVAKVDREVTAVVVAATAWTSNAHMIEDMVALGYLKASDNVLDSTYGRGIWWQRWHPERLTMHDKYTLDGVDFRDMHMHSEGEFDVVAFDPPYISKGSRVTTTMPDFQNRYGIDMAPTSPVGVQELINDGLTECARVVRSKGIVLCKCQDYVSSGKLWIGTHHTLTHALSIGLECVDRLEHIAGVRPQPPGRRQVHARRNLSTLFVFRKTR